MKPPVTLFAFAVVAALARAAAPQVTVKAFAFGPKSLVVPVGTTVMWTNVDDIEHTVTSGMPDQPNGRFDQALASKGASATVRFDSVGTWSYFCKRHSFMRGEIRITPKGER